MLHCRPLPRRVSTTREIAPLHFANGLIGSIDVIFHQAEECRRVTGADPLDPTVIEAHSRAVEFMLLGAPPAESTRCVDERIPDRFEPELPGSR